MLFDKKYFQTAGLESIYEKVMHGERLTRADGLKLFATPSLEAVGALAAHERFRRHANRTFYVVNRQINYTNICVNRCVFCAFRRDTPGQSGAFLLSHDEIMEKVDQCMHAEPKLDELHMVGGCHPDLDLDWFIRLLKRIRANYPQLPLKVFTPVEIAHLASRDGISTRQALEELQAAGLDMMPGGGAEIFDEALRSRICPEKATAREWLRISGEAHNLGIKTNCTMLFGHLETAEQRVDHLCRLREQQDKSGGFTCFIPLPFLKENNRLELAGERKGPGEALDRLRVIAVSRLMLDNIDHIKAYWVMLGHKLAPVALEYGADDLDGTIVEEKIGHMAGADSSSGMSIPELEHMIMASGFKPVRRNATFETYDQNSEATAI